MRRKKASPEDLLAAVAAAADDGFCLASSLLPNFRGLSHRDLVRLRGRAVRNGLLLERRGPDGRLYLALTSEGWQALRSSAES
ncbi:MAG: hypothetical protein ACLGG5_03480 [Thermoleophilia bacterium]